MKMTDDRIQLDDREFRLSRYLDGDLDAAESLRIEREIETDPELRRLLEQYRRTDQSVKASAGPVPEPDWDRFREQVLWRCRAADAPRRRFGLYRLIAPLAAAAGIVLAFTLYMRSKPGGVGTEPKAMVNSEAPTPDVSSPVVSVVFDRTPRPSSPEADDAPDDEGSYVIAAAGASPLDDPSLDEEVAPTF